MTIPMSIEITVPRLGWSMEEGTFCRWLKANGEMVREGDELFEFEGEKATQVIESFDAGILRIGADGPQDGDIVKVGQVIGQLEPRNAKAGAAKKAATAASAAPASAPAPKTAAKAPAPAPVASVTVAAPQPAPKAAPQSHAVEVTGGVVSLASPSVRRMARELGVDLKSIASGGKYTVSASDVLSAVCNDAISTATTMASPPARFNGGRPVSPRARRVAGELNINPAVVPGTGLNGRVREADIRDAAAQGGSRPRVVAPPSAGAGGPVSQLRRVIAQRMMVASHETAPVTLTATADASELVRFRDECKRTSADRGVKPPRYTELFVKLSAAALEKHPAMLGQWIDERIVQPDGIHVAVAVDTPQGLLTPVIRNVPALSLRELSTALAELIDLARSRRLKVEQMQAGAFTVSSLGGYRVEAFTPLLNPPQTAILGVGRISKQPVVRDGQLAVGDIVTLSLSFDHRVVDGAPAAAFLTSLCDVIENPLGWLLS
jgi:pyruvate dehydrogenase E2 component (dihydrolipoamide acetyltransferase)